jgi:S-formylglutathione hydrolase FrmB
MPRRAFTLRRLSQSLGIRSIFGPEGSVTRTANDPFALAKAADPNSAPFLFLAVSKQEGLVQPVERFALLRSRHIPHSFFEGSGSHGWQQWNNEMPELITSLESKH